MSYTIRIREISRTTVDGATVEPLTLADAKNYLKVPSIITADDALIQDLIYDARITCEAAVSMTFVQATYEMVLDYFPPVNGNASAVLYAYNKYGVPFYQGAADWAALGIRFPFGPLVSVDSCTYLDMNGVTQTLDLTPDGGKVVIVTGRKGQMTPQLGKIFPITKPIPGAVTIQFTAGSSTTGQEPLLAPVRKAMRYQVAKSYLNRGEGYEADDILINILSPIAIGRYA